VAQGVVLIPSIIFISCIFVNCFRFRILSEIFFTFVLHLGLEILHQLVSELWTHSKLLGITWEADLASLTLK